MSQRFQMLIVEDNQQLANSVAAFFLRKNVIGVCGIAQNSLEAIEMLNTNGPDVIVLDLVMPKSDGFVLLEYLKYRHGGKKPDVIVLSSLNHETIIQKACELGAIYYMVKPFNMEDLHDRVLDILSMRPKELAPPSLSPIPAAPPPAPAAPEAAAPAPESKARLPAEQQLESIFMNIGIPPQNRGFLFLCKAILLVAEKPEMIFNLSRELYPAIAAQCNTTRANVEHSIRHSIEVAWQSGKLANINQIFHSNAFTSHYKPTNGEFISIVAKLFSTRMNTGQRLP